MHARHRFVLVLHAAQTASLVTSVAGAQSIEAQPRASAAVDAREEDAMAEAEQAFLEGRRLLRDGRAAEACASFAASQDRYSSAATLLNLGNCFEAGDAPGGLLEARRSFERALLEVDNVAEPTAREGLRAEARRRLRNVDAVLPTLLLRPSRTPGARVSLDGVPVAPLGVPLPQNPGLHRVEIRAAGRVGYVAQLQLEPGRRLDLQLPELEPEPVASRPSQPLPPPQRLGNAPLWLGAASVVLGAGWLFTGVRSRLYDTEYGEQLDRCRAACDEAALRRLRQTGDAAKTYAVVTDFVFMPATLLTLGTAGVLWALDGLALTEPRVSTEANANLGAACSREGCFIGAAARF